MRSQDQRAYALLKFSDKIHVLYSFVIGYMCVCVCVASISFFKSVIERRA